MEVIRQHSAPELHKKSRSRGQNRRSRAGAQVNREAVNRAEVNREAVNRRTVTRAAVNRRTVNRAAVNRRKGIYKTLFTI